MADKKKDMSDELTEVLTVLQATAGILGSAVVSADGFAIASELPGSVEERRVSAMAAAMLALGEQTANEFEQGRLERVFVEGMEGYTIVTSAGPEAVLAAIASKDAKLGMVFLHMGRAAESVKEVMAG
jgi:predicted regulator of Ras-like GTPase activity (Roadblock/LC7/MglB family)